MLKFLERPHLVRRTDLLIEAHGPLWVRRLDNTKYKPINIYRVGRNTRKTVNVWACMSIKGTGHICQIEGRLNSVTYLNIIENEFVPYLEDNYPLSDYAMNRFRFFMHDG